MKTWRVMLVALTLAVPVAASALAGDDAEQANISVRFRVDRPGGDTVRSYEVLVVAGSETEFEATSRVPIPTRSWQAADKKGEKVPLTSFSFANAGFQASLGARLLDGGRIRVHGQVKDTRPVAEHPSGPEPPPPAKFDTFTHEFDALLHDGVAVALLRFDDPLAGRAVLTIEATVRAAGGGATRR